VQACAAEVGTELQVAPSLSHFSHTDPNRQVSVGLAGDHQVLNASLAVALVRSWEQTHLTHLQQQQQQQQCDSSSAASDGGDAAAERLQQLQEGVLPLAYCEGLRKATWPGRSQVSCAGDE
jgi:folylpolyglutamate synthase/dihydropteroate synthase